MAYTLGNKYAKNICKRIVLLQLIIENVVTCFFGTQCTYPQKNHDFYRATRMHSADYAVAKVRPSVYLSVCLSHAGIVSKQLYISSMFFHRQISPPF